MQSAKGMDALKREGTRGLALDLDLSLSERSGSPKGGLHAWPLCAFQLFY